MAGRGVIFARAAWSDRLARSERCSDRSIERIYMYLHELDLI